MSNSNFIKHSTLTAGLVSILNLAGLVIAIPSHAIIIELGDLSTWEDYGDVLAVPETASMSTNALENDDSGIGSDDTFNFSGNTTYPVGIPDGLEERLGLDIGDLDPDPDPPNFLFAFEGSAIKKAFTVEAGDILVFDYRFLTNEPSRPIPIGPLPDYAFLTIDNLNDKDAGGNSDCEFVMNDFGNKFVLCTLAEVSDATIPSSRYTNKTGIESFSFTFSEGGDFTIGLGVVDVEDFNVSSALIINPIPEPTSSLSFLVLGTLGTVSTLKRKRKSSK